MASKSDHSAGASVAPGQKPLDVRATKADWKQPGQPARTWKYPTPPATGGVTETIQGVEIKDPWRALEDLESEDTLKFFKDQNALSTPYLHSHPLRKSLESAVEQSLSYVRTTPPNLQADGYYYWLYNDGSFQRDVMVRSRNLDAHFGKPAGKDGAEVVFDPNLEENISLYMYSWSPSGKLLSLILQESGSDWQTIRTIDVETKKVIDDELGWAKFTFGATYVGEQGIMYKRIIGGPSPSGHGSDLDGRFGYFYHKFHTPQAEDVLVWYGTGEHAKTQFIGRPRIISHDEKEGSGRRSWLYFDIYKSTSPETENLIVELPGGQKKESLAKFGESIPQLILKDRRWLTKGYSGDLRYIGTLPDDRALFRSTTDGVTAGRIVSYDLTQWNSVPADSPLPVTEIVPADPDNHVLLSAHLIAGKVLVLIYLRHACAAVVFVDALTGKPIGATDPRGTTGEVVADGPIDLPVPSSEIKSNARPPIMIPKHASITTVTSRADSNDFYMAVDTYVSTPYVLAGHLADGPHGIEVDVHGLGTHADKNEDLVCRQIFYTSHDGTKIPMFIAHRADLDTSQPQPSLLYAYGGFSAPVLPKFDPFFTAFMRNLNGVLAVANIRGGGEYGKPWHEAAIGIKRAVAWDDYAWAAKYLHENKISEPRLTSAYGSSNGGLLVSAALNRTPELFGVILPDVPVEDLTRYHKHAMGRIWQNEYGSPDDPELLPTIIKLSPLHNVNPDPAVTYPATLVTTADHDTRVIPGHTFKFIAELQKEKAGNKNPLLTRVYINSGHEAGAKSIAQRTEETVDRLVFILLSTEAPSS